jgi:hypothetical protein
MMLLLPSLGEEGLVLLLFVFKLKRAEPAEAAAMAAARRIDPVREVVVPDDALFLLWEEVEDSGSPPAAADNVSLLLLLLLIMGVSSLDVLRELSIIIYKNGHAIIFADALL